MNLYTFTLNIRVKEDGKFKYIQLPAALFSKSYIPWNVMIERFPILKNYVSAGNTEVDIDDSAVPTDVVLINNEDYKKNSAVIEKLFAGNQAVLEQIKEEKKYMEDNNKLLQRISDLEQEINDGEFAGKSAGIPDLNEIMTP